MEIAKIRISKDSAKILKYRKVPSGLIGGTIAVEYDSFWAALEKQVVFEGAVDKTIFTNESIIKIPKEVVAKAGPRLQIGFIGSDASRNLLIPSFYIDLGQIRKGADSSGDSTTDSTLPGWAQLIGRMDDLEDMVENGFTGPIGPQGIPGKDGYTPIKGIDYFDGKDGYTPVKGVDYFDGYTPVKGVDYFDGAPGKDGYTPVKGVDYVDGKDGYTPVKGVDYVDGYTPVKGVDYVDGYTPQKGIDYFDGKDGHTPVKGVDYFDGKDGRDGVDGKDYVPTPEDLTKIAEQAADLVDIPDNIAQADWNAAEGEPGHILNRPFYTEVEEGFVEVVPEVTIDTVDGRLPRFDVIEGDRYRVTIDGVPYEATTITATVGIPEIRVKLDAFELYIYNEPAFPLWTSSVPFGTYPAEITIRVEHFRNGEIVHKIPEKYLPDNMGGSQADWNANEGEPGHILNRPFYSEPKTVTLLDTTLTANGSFGGLDGVGFLPELLDISDGMECNVVYNGVEYVCTARETTFQNLPCVILGNSYAFGDENTGEPFLLCAFSALVASYAGICGGVIPLDGSGTFSISIIWHTEDITPIPLKYLENVRAQKKYILDYDAKTASAPAPSKEEVDTGELQAAITLVYQGAEHSVVVTNRSSIAIEGMTIDTVEFFFVDHSLNVHTGTWNLNSINIVTDPYTFAAKFAEVGKAPWFYMSPSSSSNPHWRSMEEIELPGIKMISPTGKRFWLTVDDNGNLTATQK